MVECWGSRNIFCMSFQLAQHVWHALAKRAPWRIPLRACAMGLQPHTTEEA